jgi:hypothetical protein
MSTGWEPSDEAKDAGALAARATEQERGVAVRDVIERLVVCIDTDALHEELDAWVGDRMASTRILRSHITRALAGRKGEE